MKKVLYISLAWLPFDKTMAFDLGVMSLTLYHLAILALFIFTVIQVLRGRLRYTVNATDFALVAVCSMYLTSTLLSRNPQTAGLLAFNAIFIPTLTYFVSKTLLTDERSLLLALGMYGAGVLVVATVGGVEFVALQKRPYPFDQDGVALASLAVLPLMTGLYAARHMSMALRGALILGGLIAVSVSISRVYWLFVLISPVLFYFFMRGRAAMVAGSTVAVTLALTLVITLDREIVAPVNIDYKADHGIERVLNPDHWKAALYNRVVFMYEPSIEEFVDAPFFGKGLFVPEYQGTTTHNFHLEWLETGGALGYVAFLLVYLTHFWQVSRRGKADSFACAISLATLAILLNGVTNGIMHSVMPTCAMLCVGLTAARLQSLRASGANNHSVRGAWMPSGYSRRRAR